MSRLLDVHVKSKCFGATQVLEDVRLSLDVGEVVSLVGASGCGKSTLLRIVAGLERSFDGSVCFDGQPLTGLSREIGFIFQEPRLFPWLSVAENIGFDRGHAGRDDPRVSRLLAEVGMAGFERTLPKQLSGGQAQRVAIARGLFTQPRLLLLDEPFSAVDAFTRMKLQDLLIELARRHRITVLLVTHDVDEASYLSDRVLVLQSQPGRLCEDIAVPLSRPRDRGQGALSAVKAQVLMRLQAVHAL
jgi:sulfonate transport system ATP-binding protein